MHHTYRSACDQYQDWAAEAVDQWDGQSNFDLIESIREKFGQSREQFYADTFRELRINHKWED